MSIPACGLLFGFDLHHVDHIAPLCHFLNIPLIVTEEAVKECIETYYPKMDLRLLSAMEFTKYILNNFSLLFTTLPRQLIDPLFFLDEQLLRKKIYTFWLPHGNSDKDNLGALTKEKLLLIYGNQMEDTLKRHNILPLLYKTVKIGALRRHFFEKHRPFYERVIPNLHFEKKQPTLLFAPTWGNPDLHKEVGALITNLPNSYNLIIKLHPNSLHDPLFKELIPNRKNILFLDHFPPIFPVLEQVDFYIGDHSSIAYDFLYYNRPLFFLSQKKTTIHLTGKTVHMETLFKDLEKPDDLSKVRQEIYHYAFDPTVDFTTLKGAIESTSHSFLKASSLD